MGSPTVAPSDVEHAARGLIEHNLRGVLLRGPDANHVLLVGTTGQ